MSNRYDDEYPPIYITYVDLNWIPTENCAAKVPFVS